MDSPIVADYLAGIPYARSVMEESAAESGGLILTAPVFAEVLSSLLAAKPQARALDIRSFADDATVLPFDKGAALVFAEETARLAREGIRPRLRDAQIASIALAHNLTLVAREARDYPHFSGLKLRSPPGPGAAHR